MALAHSPSIVRNGLVLHFDAANQKSSALTNVEVLVVAGGGAGVDDRGGGGGGGGVVYNSSYTVTPGTPVTVTVGDGGAAKTDRSQGNNGGNSVFGSITALGGGGGGTGGGANGSTGGSGGGAGNGNGRDAFTTGGLGTSGQGFDGGASRYLAPNYGGGGGGGAGGPGYYGTSTFGGNGGPGIPSDISGTLAYYGAGGGGGSGIVIVRYSGPQRATGGTVTRVDNHTIHTFTTVGSSTFTPWPSLSNGTEITGLSNVGSAGHVATPVNGPTYSSSNSGSITLDSNDYFTVPMDNLRPTTGITQSVWFKSTSASAGQVFIGSQYGTSSNNSYALWWENTQWLGGVNTGGTFYFLNVTYPKVAGVWYNFVHTYDGAIQRLYVNSAEIGSQVRTGTITYDTNNTQLIIGADWNGSGYNSGPSMFVIGSMPVVRIYNRALTAAEVKQNFEATRGRYGI